MSDPQTAGPAAVTAARTRWRAAEDGLFPALVLDPDSYRRATDAVGAVLAELRRRCTTLPELIGLQGAAAEIVTAAYPEHGGLSADLLFGVASAMRDRELVIDDARRRRDEAVARARAAGSAWALLEGPDDPAELTHGRAETLHLASGTVVALAVDPWSGAPPFTLTVTAPAGDTRTWSFPDREQWVARYRQLRAAVEDGLLPSEPVAS
jgi:hypothetical protein